MQQVFILSAVRTAIGKFGGSLKDITPAKLGAVTIKEALNRANIEVSQVDEVIMGNAIQAGQGQNPARQASINAGLPVEVPAYTVNMACGSGLKAVGLAANIINNGEAEIVVAGGMENMSRAPYCLKNQRWGKKMGNDILEDLLLKDGLMDAFYNYHMGVTAENIAQKYNISRETQDKFAELSQNRAQNAIVNGKFKDEIVPIKIKDKKTGEIEFKIDEFPRFDTKYETLSNLRPSFKEGGTVTAGNASGINDGAAALVLASEKKVKELSLQPMARIVGVATAGVDPQYMGMGPVDAVKKVLKMTDICLQNIDLIELNEAFAAQAVAVLRELDLDINKVNVNGGAIALGHPIGASGARILVTLLHEMEKRRSKYGLAALCIGGGMGIAGVIER